MIDPDRIYRESDFTEAFCVELVHHYGNIQAAADAIAPQSFGTKIDPISSRIVQRWMSVHVGPRRALLRAAQRAASDAPGIDLSRPSDPERLNRIDDLIDRSNVDLEAIGGIEHVTLNSWSGFMKDKDGNPQRVPLYQTKVKLVPPPTAIVTVPEPSKVVAYVLDAKRKRATETLRVFIIGDCQLGFWSVLDPDDSQRLQFVPFHDENAIDLVMQALALYAPDIVIIIGDFIDFPQLSRFQQEPEWAQTLQATIDYAELLIAKIRKTVGPACEIIFIPGNHETRMQRAIVNNVPALYQLRRPGEKYALYSVSSLLRFEAHRVECMAEFPSGKFMIAPRQGLIPACIATHADPKKRDMRCDTVHGHKVLPGIETFSREDDDGNNVILTRMCVSGTANYSDTPDAVRLTRTNTPSGRSGMAYVNSFGTIDIDRETGQRAYAVHLIRDKQVRFLDRMLTARALAVA